MRSLARLLPALLLLFVAAAAVAAAERCDGCGMFLAPHGRTLHRLTLAGGERRTFCSLFCLAGALERLPAGQAGEIEAADHATGRFVDSRAAAYVAGSDVPPVMGGVSLVAFGSPAAAAGFRDAHGGDITDFTGALEKQRRGAVGAPAAAADLVEHGSAYVSLPKPGKRIPLGGGRSFVFSFDKKPAMETVIVKVEVFTAAGARDTALEIRGNADMPSMRCQSGKPDRSFVRNRKGDHLLPFTFGMPGGWEVYLAFVEEGKVVFRGKYAFEI